MGAARRLPVLPFAAGIVVGALLGWHRSTLTGAEPRSSRAEAFVPALHPMRSVAARTPATVEQRGLRGAGGEEDARTRGPYYGDVEQPGELERMVRLVSLNGELVLHRAVTQAECIGQGGVVGLVGEVGSEVETEVHRRGDETEDRQSR